MLPLGPDAARHNGAAFESLSAEQRAICGHVWGSPDRVMLIRGAAGTGKTRTMRAAMEGIDKPAVVLASPPPKPAGAFCVRRGFAEADTVARFLIDEEMQAEARGGVIWVDEAGLLGIRQVAQLFDIAEKLDARVILQGDRRQHGSVERGATMRVMEEFAGLPVAELKDIRRQRGQYKAAVNSLSKGEMLEGYDRLAGLGWVRQAESNQPLVADCLASLDEGKSVLVVAPTHVEGDELTAEIRDAHLQERGLVGKEERVFERLVPLGWTEAERADPAAYDGSEVIQFHRNSRSLQGGATGLCQRLPLGEMPSGSFRPCMAGALWPLHREKRSASPPL